MGIRIDDNGHAMLHAQGNHDCVIFKTARPQSGFPDGTVINFQGHVIFLSTFHQCLIIHRVGIGIRMGDKTDLGIGGHGTDDVIGVAYFSLVGVAKTVDARNDVIQTFNIPGF